MRCLIVCSIAMITLVLSTHAAVLRCVEKQALVLATARNLAVAAGSAREHTTNVHSQHPGGQIGVRKGPWEPPILRMRVRRSLQAW
jgi:hypothetical protein